jgi:hypothetical protein
MYRLGHSNWIVRLADGAFIPPDEGNADYQEYLVWLEDENVPEPYTPPPPAVPSEISFRQLVLALWQRGFITEVEAVAAAEMRARPAALDEVIATLPAADATIAKITWASMSVALRSDSMFSLLVSAGKATEEQVDDVFRLGVTL